MKKILTLFMLMVLTAIASAQAKRVSILGDSYSTFQGMNPEGYAPFYPNDRNDVTEVEQTWWSLYIKAMGYELDKNNSWGGTTICNTGYGGMDATRMGFLSRVEMLGQPDIIFLFGGTNDAWANSPIGEYKYEGWTDEDCKAFRPALACLLHKLHTLYPKAVIYSILNSELKEEINESSRNICKHYGVQLIELVDIEKQNGHPSIKGMQAICDQLLEAIDNNKSQNPGPITTGPHTIAQTIYGQIQGYCDDGIFTFKGVPYAKAERFMAPQYPDLHEGVMKCQVYGAKAMQDQNVEWHTPSDYDFGFQFKTESMSEDCQVLNIWTPALDGKKRPVFLWIHGGGYANGSAIFLPAQDGRSLAEKGDIVVVTVNHRLNVLGYLDLRSLGGRYAQSVNLGMQDLVKALEWVHSNISAFGGDPDCVTIGGQSGGGGKVSTLMAMPSAKGLFHRAIVQSGSTLRQMESEQATALCAAFLDELGLTPKGHALPKGHTAPTIADSLASIPYPRLNAAASRACRKVGGRLSPVVDGEVLTQHPFDPVAPEVSRNVPMLIGSNLNEFCYDNNVEFRIDTLTRQRVLDQATVKAKQEGAPAYVYLFAWCSQVNDGALAACHGMELPFMFRNVALQREMTGGTPEAYRMADRVSSAWIQFIKTGNPNPPELPDWKAFDPDDKATMVLCDDSHME